MSNIIVNSKTGVTWYELSNGFYYRLTTNGILQLKVKNHTYTLFPDSYKDKS